MALPFTIDTSTKILLRLVLIIAGLYFLYLIRDVVLLVAFAILTAAALSPIVNKLQYWHFSRTGSVIIVYTSLLLGGAALLSVFLPVFFSEVKDFIQSWPTYAKRLDVFMSGIQGYLNPLGIDFEKDQFFADIEGNMANWLSEAFSTTVSVFKSFIHLMGFFFLALYLSLEEKGIEKLFLLLTPKQYHTQALSIVSRMQSKVSQWLFGQVLLMLIAFVIYYIGLTLLGVPYALAIAFFGGMMEILPYIGPVLAAIPAILFGLLVSPVLGVSALLFYIIAHQVEAHIVAPQVMKHSAGLNPVALIIAVLIGFELAGPLGIIIAVPVTMMLSVFVDDILEKRQS